MFQVDNFYDRHCYYYDGFIVINNLALKWTFTGCNSFILFQMMSEISTLITDGFQSMYWHRDKAAT